MLIFPCDGVEGQRQKLEAEGFTVLHSKGGYSVENYEEFVAEL